VGLDVEQAEFENLKQTHGTGANNDGIGLDRRGAVDHVPVDVLLAEMGYGRVDKRVHGVRCFEGEWRGVELDGVLFQLHIERHIAPRRMG
jgi:hypothetical protein